LTGSVHLTGPCGFTRPLSRIIHLIWVIILNIGLALMAVRLVLLASFVLSVSALEDREVSISDLLKIIHSMWMIIGAMLWGYPYHIPPAVRIIVGIFDPAMVRTS
jgi:hypothetical protein